MLRDLQGEVWHINGKDEERVSTRDIRSVLFITPVDATRSHNIGRRISEAMMELGWTKAPGTIRCHKGEQPTSGYTRPILLSPTAPTGATDVTGAPASTGSGPNWTQPGPLELRVRPRLIGGVQPGRLDPHSLCPQQTGQAAICIDAREPCPKGSRQRFTPKSPDLWSFFRCCEPCEPCEPYSSKLVRPLPPLAPSGHIRAHVGTRHLFGLLWSSKVHTCTRFTTCALHVNLLGAPRAGWPCWNDPRRLRRQAFAARLPFFIRYISEKVAADGSVVQAMIRMCKGVLNDCVARQT
jgi:hypothetical protein